MLKTRVIPTLLWKNVGLVKGIGFESSRRIGSVMPAVKVYNKRDVDELVLLDIMATAEGRTPDFGEIESISPESFVPFTIGGGVRSLETVKQLLRVGADKVAINSAAYEDPRLVRDAADRFGAQCVVASIDVRKHESDGRYECFSHCGSRPTGREVVAWAIELEKLGAGEILLTSVERDGTMSGYDIELVQRVSSRVSIPVIASGGAGSYEDMRKVVVDGGAAAVAAASMFQFTEQTPLEAKRYLASKGIPARLPHSATT